MTEKIKYLVRLGNVYFLEYILNECNVILEEQRKINVQLQMRKATSLIRGKQLTKPLILEFLNAINMIPFKETQKIQNFKQEMYEAYTIFNEYYTDDGIRKS